MKKKVLFIMGAGHCGSSLLALILGSHPQCFSAGELQGLPNRYGKNLYIDCVNCNSQFWEETFGDAGLKKLADGLADARLNKYVPLKAEKVIRGWLGTDEVFNPYSFMLSQLEKEVIIDASKSYEWIKKKIKGKEFKSGKIEGYLLHRVWSKVVGEDPPQTPPSKRGGLCQPPFPRGVWGDPATGRAARTINGF